MSLKRWAEGADGQYVTLDNARAIMSVHIDGYVFVQTLDGAHTASFFWTDAKRIIAEQESRFRTDFYNQSKLLKKEGI